MFISNVHISAHRTDCWIAYFGVSFLLFLVPYGASVQSNKTVASVCPSGYECFSSAPRNVTVEFGYNGNICQGQTVEQCYKSDSDPRGFVAGPRQWPVTIQQGDGLIVKSSDKYNFAIQLYNASRRAFYSCDFNGMSAIVPTLTTLPFVVPKRFIAETGIKYFIAKSDNMVIQCQFGLKLEVNVRSRDPCLNQSAPENGVCSSKGLCATIGDFFTKNASCLCNTGYLGSYCGERDSCHVALNPCRNGATCTDKTSGLIDDYNCTCLPGYNGKNCENDINDCNTDPCLNGSICIDKVNDYTCLCSPGYIGKNCNSLAENKCDLKPCQNGGTCDRSGVNRQNYTCTCPDAFTGRNCTENVTIPSVITHTSVMTTIGKSSVLSDVASRTSTLDTQGGRTSTTLQTVSLSLTQSGKIPTTSQTLSSSVLSQSTGAVTQSLTNQLLPSSTHLSESSTIVLDSSLSIAPSISMTTQSTLARTQTSLIISSFPTSIVREKTSEVLSSSSTSSLSEYSSSITPLSSSNIELPVTTSKSIQRTSLSNSSTSTTPFMPSTAQVSSSFSVHSSVFSIMTTSLLTKTVMSTSSVTTSAVASSKDVSLSKDVSSSSSTRPSVSTSVMSTTVMSTSSVTTSAVASSKDVSLSKDVSSSSSTRPSVSTSVMSTTVMSTSSVTTSAVASSKDVSLSKDVSSSSSSTRPSVSTSTQIFPTSTFVSTTTTSSVIPTTVPTTVPLREQTCQNKPCNNGTCQDVPDQLGLNFTCQCPKPMYGPRCSTDFKLHFPRFSNGSYLVHKPIAFTAGLNKIVITFKTTAANGLLFYSTHSKYKDFIQLYVTGGKLEYRFDPGDYLGIIKSDVEVNTGKIVTAVVTYDSRNKQGTLQVGNNVKQTKTSLGRMVGIGLYNAWFIGGLPPGKTIGVGDGGKATPTFIGCIKDIELNTDQIGFTEATDWNNLSECDTPCKDAHKPCHNNGTCIPDPDDPHDYECKCPGFEGKNCKTPTVCSGDPCNGGLCIPDNSKANTSKVCLCPFGRGGGECKNELNITIPKFTMAYNYSSYIQYKVPTLSGPYFVITLQFKIDSNSTAWDNSLLMFGGQNEYQGKGDDFIALGINNSRVLFQYNLGSGIAYIQSDPIDTTRKWHSITAGRNGKEGYIFLDNQKIKRGSSPGQLSGLNLYSPLYIGGVPDLTELPTDVVFKKGFEGCIAYGAVRFGEAQPFIRLLTSQKSNNVNEWSVVEGRNIGEEGYDGCNTSNPCQNNGTCTQKGAVIVCSCVDGWKGMYCASREIPCINYNPCADKSTCREVNNKAVCDCPLGKTGNTCSIAISIQKPRFKDNSYMAFTPTAPNIRLITEITIKFTPHNENGLLFYVAHKISTQKGDFLSISLHNGFVQYRYNLGSGIASIQDQKNISLNNEHNVTITRNQLTGDLKVDGEATIPVKSPGSAVALDVGSNFYLGGVPQLSLVNPSAVADVKSLKDFVGCVTSVMVNGITLRLTETGAVQGRNIDDCPISKVANNNDNLA